MMEQNEQRALVSILKEICSNRDIAIHAFSNNWIFCLKKGTRQTYIFGYDFGINSATAKLICKDKSATSDLLQFHGIPHVDHSIFHGPQLAAYVPMTGNWSPMLQYFESASRDVVCKPTEGTGGRGVLRARSVPELEAAVMQILARNRSLCISPYEHVVAEYRVAVLRGVAQFAYCKVRPFVVGDGRMSIRDLLLQMLQSGANLASSVELLPEALKSIPDPSRVPSSGEHVVLNWRHNLGQGAKPDLLNIEEPKMKPIVALALRSAEALGVELASVDVVEVPTGIKILEINSGIMMENLASTSPEGRKLAAGFYDRIICSSLGIAL